MAQPPFLLLVHSGFNDSVVSLGSHGEQYYASLLKQLEKLQWDPHRVGNRYDCDGLPDEYGDFIRKCDIKGPNGPKLFFFVWNERSFVLPFFVTRDLRKDIDYRKLPITQSAESIIHIVDGWPGAARECELWRIKDGVLAKINAGEYLSKGHR